MKQRPPARQENVILRYEPSILLETQDRLSPRTRGTQPLHDSRPVGRRSVRASSASYNFTALTSIAPDRTMKDHGILEIAGQVAGRIAG